MRKLHTSKCHDKKKLNLLLISYEQLINREMLHSRHRLSFPLHASRIFRTWSFPRHWTWTDSAHRMNSTTSILLSNLWNTSLCRHLISRYRRRYRCIACYLHEAKLYASPNIIRAIKSTWMTCWGHVARMGRWEVHTRVYPKVAGVAAWCENCKWYSSLPLGAVVSLFCESV